MALLALVLITALLGALGWALALLRRLRRRDHARSISLLRATLESTADGIVVVDRQGRIVSFNWKFVEMWQVPEAALDTRDDEQAVASILDRLQDPDGFLGRLGDLYAHPELESHDIIALKDGRVFERYSQPQRLGGEIVGRVWSFRDITERRQLEEQLRQSQKIEAVGRLAGGVAHDFNNLLTAIRGYIHVLLEELPAGDSLRSDLEEIRKAAERASGLTRQLLAFSRKQLLQPRVLDMNGHISDMERMLRRLIGEDLELVTVLDPALGRIKADPNQIEQVLLNLVVNARDAMPAGGKLLIETRNVDLDDGYARKHAYVQPGAYVLLAVSDTGCGIPMEIQEQIFEPFFTTKEVGKGTGLGLSTVYGIVKQSGGYIWVYSEVGQGTTFKIYLPRVDEEVEAIPPGRVQPLAPPIALGTETVLLVEDEDAVRSLAQRVLQNRGYTVLGAKTGEEAIALCGRHDGEIHLLLTDVVMPEMSGRELAERLSPLRPEMRTLFMSGYTEDDVLRRGVLEAGAAFLEKPFTPDTLIRKVRQLLDLSR